MSMGDFNDDPINSGFKNILKTKDKKEDVKPGELFNPMEAMLKKGMGTLAYQDGWNLFDQIYFTYDLLKRRQEQLPLLESRYFQPSLFGKPQRTLQRISFPQYGKRQLHLGLFRPLPCIYIPD